MARPFGKNPNRNWVFLRMASLSSIFQNYFVFFFIHITTSIWLIIHCLYQHLLCHTSAFQHIVPAAWDVAEYWDLITAQQSTVNSQHTAQIYRKPDRQKNKWTYSQTDVLEMKYWFSPLFNFVPEHKYSGIGASKIQHCFNPRQRRTTYSLNETSLLSGSVST